MSPAANLPDGLLHGELAPALDVVEDIEFGKMPGWWSTFAGDRVAAGNVIHTVQAHCFLHWQAQVGYMFGPRHVCASPGQQVHISSWAVVNAQFVWILLCVWVWATAGEMYSLWVAATCCS